MKLTRARVKNYRSIDDSSWVKLEDVTALVGKNESGKTAFLQALRKINSIVHPEVINDFKVWVKENRNEKILFKEAAILFESGSYKDLDCIIFVSADKELRISRVLSRDSFRTRDEIEKIINGQMSDEMASKKSDYILKNDEKELLLPRVIKILDKIKEKA